MRRPEKKELYTDADHGYNQACDDWEKYIPSLESIRQTIYQANLETALDDTIDNVGCKYLASAIHKRLRGDL